MKLAQALLLVAIGLPHLQIRRGTLRLLRRTVELLLHFEPQLCLLLLALLKLSLDFGVSGQHRRRRE